MERLVQMGFYLQLVQLLDLQQCLISDCQHWRTILVMVVAVVDTCVPSFTPEYLKKRSSIACYSTTQFTLLLR